MPLRRTPRPKFAPPLEAALRRDIERTPAPRREPDDGEFRPRVPKNLLDAYMAHRLAKTPDEYIIFGVWGVTVTYGDLKDLVDECDPTRREKEQSRRRLSQHNEEDGDPLA